MSTLHQHCRPPGRVPWIRDMTARMQEGTREDCRPGTNSSKPDQVSRTTNNTNHGQSICTKIAHWKELAVSVYTMILGCCTIGLGLYNPTVINIT